MSNSRNLHKYIAGTWILDKQTPQSDVNAAVNALLQDCRHEAVYLRPTEAGIAIQFAWRTPNGAIISPTVQQHYSHTTKVDLERVLKRSILGWDIGFPSTSCKANY
jgi:hypothetical protein